MRSRLSGDGYSVGFNEINKNSDDAAMAVFSRLKPNANRGDRCQSQLPCRILLVIAKLAEMTASGTAIRLNHDDPIVAKGEVSRRHAADDSFWAPGKAGAVGKSYLSAPKISFLMPHISIQISLSRSTVLLHWSISLLKNVAAVYRGTAVEFVWRTPHGRFIAFESRRRDRGSRNRSRVPAVYCRLSLSSKEKLRAASPVKEPEELPRTRGRRIRFHSRIAGRHVSPQGVRRRV